MHTPDRSSAPAHARESIQFWDEVVPGVDEVTITYRVRGRVVRVVHLEPGAGPVVMTEAEVSAALGRD